MNIARSFKDPRVKIIEDNVHLGLAGRLNQALDGAQTQFVARMDADDIATPNGIQQLGADSLCMKSMALREARAKSDQCALGSWRRL